MAWYVLADTLRAGTGTITPAYPTGWAAGDIFVIFIETQATETVTTPTGYTASAINPQTATGTRLWMFWRRAVGGDTAPTIADPGDHMLVQLFAVRGATTSGNPFRTEAGGNVATSTTADFLSAAATAGDLCFLVNGVATALTFTPGTYTNLETPVLTQGYFQPTPTDAGGSTTAGNDGALAIIVGLAATTANVDASGTWSSTSTQTQGTFAMIPASSNLSTARVGIGTVTGPPTNVIKTARIGYGVVIDTNATYTAPSGRRRGFMSAVP